MGLLFFLNFILSGLESTPVHFTVSEKYLIVNVVVEVHFMSDMFSKL